MCIPPSLSPPFLSPLSPLSLFSHPRQIEHLAASRGKVPSFFFYK
jgi:hypothetical protein